MGSRSHLRRVLYFTFMTFIASLCIVLMQAPYAHAYVTEGVYWSNNYSIQLAISSSMTSNDKSAADKAYSAWNASAAPIDFVSGSAGVYVYDENDGNNGYDGYSTYTTGVGSCSNLSGYETLARGNAWANTYATNGYPVAEIQSVMAHELGHTLGLAHATIGDALMYPNTGVRYGTYGITGPVTDDINGTNYIYSHC